ncbi:MAG: hypothetical protein NW205_08275 [Hyphomicrobiaceae bacterium]|nr:hypothetical protein [Hyphomicrobiaceae bacterium]
MEEFSGYTVAYDRDEAPVPVYASGGLAALMLTGALFSGNSVLFVIGAAALGFAYYNYPLAETGRPRLGANQYGVFIEGFGIVHWRAIDKIDLVVIAVRALTVHELQITLNQPLRTALIADWRRVPWYRMPMRLPWQMTHTNVVRITLDPFDRSPEEIHRNITRMWKHYRS